MYEGAGSRRNRIYDPGTRNHRTQRLESPFAVTRMSGATPQGSTAKFVPVRPIPVITSSAINRTPCRLQISATCCTYSSGGTAAPSVAPLTGSKINAAASPPELFNCPLYLRHILPAAILASVRAAIAVRSANMDKLFHHGQIDFSPPPVPRDRQQTQRRSVVALVAAQNLVALPLPDLHLVLPRQLQCGFN
jgi:hypothetical protein